LPSNKKDIILFPRHPQQLMSVLLHLNNTAFTHQ